VSVIPRALSHLAGADIGACGSPTWDVINGLGDVCRGGSAAIAPIQPSSRAAF
jgi:hypothetical protein